MSMQKETQKKKDLQAYTDFELACELYSRYQKKAPGSTVEFKNMESRLTPGVSIGKNIIIQAGKRNYPIYLFFAEDNNLYCVDIDDPYKQTVKPLGDENKDEHMLVPGSMIERQTTGTVKIPCE